MKFCRRILLVFLVGAAGLMDRALADVTWLQPERFTMLPGAFVWMELTTAEEFGEPMTAVPLATIGEIQGWLAATSLPLAPPVLEGKVARFSAILPRPGVAIFATRLKPEKRELRGAEAEAYLRRIHVTDDVRSIWAAMSPSPWRELRTIHLKTFVRVGEPPLDDQGWSRVIGEGMEIVPERDPTSLHEGDELPVRVLRDGRPVKGIVLSFLSRGENREHVVLVDGAGEASAKLDAQGPWLVTGVRLQRVTDADYDWRSEVAAMTLEVR